MIGVGLLIVIGYAYQWTGFGASTIVTLNPNEEIQLPKTLWDWLELLVIPIVLAISAAWFSRVERRSEQAIAKQRIEEERRIADDRAQDTALQAYLEQMAALLLDKSLRQSEEGSEERAMARAWTLTFLRRLNGERKGVLLRFLYESDLITKEKSTFSLALADLSEANLGRADLSGANLSGANLSGANLSRAALGGTNLSGAYLIGANLSGAKLSEANLGRAYLSLANLSLANLIDANLMGATLIEANLMGANLMGANLRNADLMGANLMGAYLIGAALEGALLIGTNLSGALLSGVYLSNVAYSRKTIWPDGFDPVEAGAFLAEDDKEYFVFTEANYRPNYGHNTY